MVSAAELDRLMHRAWPGLLNVAIDGWIARVAGGLTQRANSVLPIECPHDVPAALRETEALYRHHGLLPTVQISPAAQPPDLDALLAERGYEHRSPTLVCTARVDAALRTLPEPTVPLLRDHEPDPEWMRLWHAVDGRGGSESIPVVRRILTSCPAVYVSVRDGAGAAAVGRLALVDGWGGMYCMAVREDARRQGHARAVLHALLQEARARRIRHTWLQVMESNAPAKALYEQAGFTPVSRYHYRTLP